MLRVSLLLFVVSFVGLVGINRSINPTRIHSVQAAALDIVFAGNSFNFMMGAVACPAVLAPGDSCHATVFVQNVGDETAEISPPTAQVSGPLYTCTGDDPANPGTGGQNIQVTFENATYAGPVSLIDPGNTESFDITFTLDLAMPNACQGKQATIAVSIQTGLPVVDPTATPMPTDTAVPTDTPVPTATATPQPTSTGTATTTASPTSSATASPSASPTASVTPSPSPSPSASASPSPTAGVAGLTVGTNFGGDAGLFSEVGGLRIDPVTGQIIGVLPSRLPVTGQGWTPPANTVVYGPLFWALGGLGGVTLLFALFLRRKEGKR